jgi:hypothetical protein
VNWSASGSPVRWAIAASIALHAVFALLLWSLPRDVRPDAPRDRGIEVEFVALRRAPPPQPDEGRQAASPNGLAPAPTVDPAPAEPASTGPAADDGGPGDLVRADHLMSSDVLADPRSRAARVALAGFGTADQMVQLCGIEAMEQVHAWDTRFQPDSVVAYAMAETKITAHDVVAEGGAIRSGKRWFNIAYRCELAPDLTRVVAFAFRLGKPIPRSGWEEHNLPDGDEPLDE